MNRETITRFFLVALCVCIPLSCVNSQQIIREMMAPIITDNLVIGQFHATYQRWPNSLAELERFANTQEVSLGLSTYENVTLQSNPDGSLLVQYNLKPPHEGRASVTVHPPGSPSPLTKEQLRKLIKDFEHSFAKEESK